MSLALGAQIVGNLITCAVAVITARHDKGMLPRWKWTVIGLAVVGTAVATVGAVSDRRDAAKQSESLQNAIDRIAANDGDDEALRRLVDATRALSEKVASGTADEIVDLQARQLPDARAVRAAELEAFKKRSVGIRAEWEPAARFILQTFDRQVEAWRARGQELQIDPTFSDDLGKMIRVGNEPASVSAYRNIALPDGTRISLSTEQGHYDEGELKPWTARLQFEPGPYAGPTRSEVLFELHDPRQDSYIAQKPSPTVRVIVWSGRPALSDEAFTRIATEEIAKTIFSAVKQVEPTPDLGTP